jgi:hypothetical protein
LDLWCDTATIIGDIVKWSLFAMIEAEELGLNSKNIDQE